MQIDLADLYKAPFGSKIETDIKIKSAKFDQEVELYVPLIGKVKIVRLEDGLLANFSINATLKLLCFRCASDFIKKVRLDFNQKYIFTDTKEKAIIDKALEEDFFIGFDEKFDLWPAIRQEILLSLPMKILCKESCKGLCQNCGQNLNQKKCKCK